MKILIALCASLVLLTGCGTADNLLQKIPNSEFKSFEYHRAGNATSSDIVATNSSIKDGFITIESLSIKEDWGPFANFNMKMEGYKRQIK